MHSAFLGQLGQGPNNWYQSCSVPVLEVNQWKSQSIHGGSLELHQLQNQSIHGGSRAPQEWQPWQKHRSQSGVPQETLLQPSGSWQASSHLQSSCSTNGKISQHNDSIDRMIDKFDHMNSQLDLVLKDLVRVREEIEAQQHMSASISNSVGNRKPSQMNLSNVHGMSSPMPNCPSMMACSSTDFLNLHGSSPFKEHQSSEIASHGNYMHDNTLQAVNQNVQSPMYTGSNSQVVPNHVYHEKNHQEIRSAYGKSPHLFSNLHPDPHQYPQHSLWLEFPDYDGVSNVEDWLLEVNYYFSYYRIPEMDRVKVCSVQMEGTAAYWLDWLLKIKGDIISWEDFCQDFIAEFGPSQFTPASRGIGETLAAAFSQYQEPREFSQSGVVASQHEETAQMCGSGSVFDEETNEVMSDNTSKVKEVGAEYQVEHGSESNSSSNVDEQNNIESYVDKGFKIKVTNGSLEARTQSLNIITCQTFPSLQSTPWSNFSRSQNSSRKCSNIHRKGCNIEFGEELQMVWDPGIKIRPSLIHMTLKKEECVSVIEVVFLEAAISQNARVQAQICQYQSPSSATPSSLIFCCRAPEFIIDLVRSWESSSEHATAIPLLDKPDAHRVMCELRMVWDPGIKLSVY